MKTARIAGLAAYGAACALVGASVALWSVRSRLAVKSPAAVATRLAGGSPTTPADAPRAGKFDAAPGDASATASIGPRSDSPAALLRRLAALRNVNTPQGARELIATLQKLRESGSAALPAIRDYLRSGADVDFDPAARGFRGGIVPLSFTNPPSLRLGLLDVVKDIGGPDAEGILVGELRTTGRGAEVAYLTAVLQQLAPDKYRDVALGAARDLLAMPLLTTAGGSLDRGDREYVYGVLASLGDPSFVTQARSELVRGDGGIDPAALRYLQGSLKADSLETVANAWQDPRLPAARKEPLARAALSYVGMDERADSLYRIALDEPALSPSQRRNLIEDLNESGFADPRHLTAADLPVIQKRLALVEELAPRATDPAAIAGFKEARKDLIKMRDDLLRPAPGH